MEKMKEVLGFWDFSYKNRWFARLSIIDKEVSTVIGTIELCLRESEDAFNHMGILRLDVRSDYEKEDMLLELVRNDHPLGRGQGICCILRQRD